MNASGYRIIDLSKMRIFEDIVLGNVKTKKYVVAALSNGINRSNILVLKRYTPDEVIGKFTVPQMIEVELMKTLKHPNLSVMAAGYSDPEQIYMLFPVCEFNMRHLLENCNSVIKNSEKKTYMLQVLRGLEYLNCEKVIHGDLSPHNILISRFGSVKITGFGNAYLKGTPPRHIPKRKVKFPYRAPEMILGDPNCSYPCDLWAFGCCMIELWTRVRLFQAECAFYLMGLIVQLCGSITTTSWPDATELENYWQLIGFNKFVQNKPRKLKKRLMPYTQDDLECCDLFDKLFVCNPERRITAAEALKHDYFKRDPLPSPIDYSINRHWNVMEKTALLKTLKETRRIMTLNLRKDKAGKKCEQSSTSK